MSDAPRRRSRPAASAAARQNGHAPKTTRSTTPRPRATKPTTAPPVEAAATGAGGWYDVVGPAASRVRATLPLRLPTARDLRRFRRRLPTQAMMAAGTAAMKLRDLTGRDVIDLESLQDLMGVAFRASMVRSSHQAGEYDIDDFGFDQQWAEIWLPLARLVYRKYWRVTTSGLENVPRSGAALLVSNHAGVFPWDAAMIKVAVHDTVYDRHVRALVANWLMATPGLSWFMRRSGQTTGNPDDTDRLLRQGELVLVFPEGVRGTGKPFAERYQLRRFGRGGYVEAAVRAGVPIIPISVMGSEEIHPMLGDIAPLANLLGVPYFPITPTLPWLGPLGMVPLPSKWHITFHPPVRTDEVGPAVSLDRGLLLEISDGVRSTIQAGLVEMLAQRRTVFGG